MKKRILTEVNVECEPSPAVTRYTFKRAGESVLEAEARTLEAWARDFEEFVRDHRSQDPVTLTVHRKYEELCSFCGSDWESSLDDGVPICCQAALDEHTAQARTA